MSDLGFVALAYGVVWFLLFAYVFSLVQREKELRRDLQLITHLLRDRELLAPEVALESTAAPAGQELASTVPAAVR